MTILVCDGWASEIKLGLLLGITGKGSVQEGMDSTARTGAAKEFGVDIDQVHFWRIDVKWFPYIFWRPR